MKRKALSLFGIMFSRARALFKVTKFNAYFSKKERLLSAESSLYRRHNINSVPNNKMLNFKAFADDKMIVTQKLKFVLGRLENMVGKGENAGYRHFLLFLQCFLKLSFPEVLRVGIVW